MMRNKAGIRTVLLMLTGLLLVAVFATVAAAEVERMSKEELLSRLNDPDVIVVDVRRGTDWRASEFMIKGAVREEGEASTWTYPKDKTLVFYCA